MKKLTLNVCIGLILSISSLAQNQNSFKYQAVLRDNQGSLIINEQVDIRISILQSSTDGPAIYIEEHAVTTNNFGLVYFNIGEGQVQSGTFSSIVWGSDDHYMQIELNRNNTGHVSVGTTPLLSVPYALHAQTVSDKSDADADPTNEIQTITLSNDTIYLSEGGAIKLPETTTGFSGSYNDLSDKPSLAGDATGSLDAVSVEKIQGQSISVGTPAVGQVLKWNGSAWAPGSDATVSGGGVDGVVESISVTGTANKTIALGLSADSPSSSLTANFTDEVEDADADTTNEIQDLSLSGNILTITKNGTATQIDLSTYLDNTNTQLTETEVDDFVANNGYLTSFTEVDGDATNEIQSLSLDGDTLLLSQNGGKVTLPAKGWGAGEALFAVVNNNSDTVFAVYESGVRIYVEDGVTKAARGGFAVASRGAAKGEPIDILNVTGDSVRIYIDTASTKAARGGFAVASRGAAKGASDDFLRIAGDSIRMYVSNSSSSKAARGGFAVASRGAAKGDAQDILNVSADSVRVYIEESNVKAARGGFAVASRGAAKGSLSEVMKVTKDSTRIYIGDANAGFGVENTSSGSSERLMRLTEENYFIGHRTGIKIEPTGLYNSFFGYEAGQENSTGSFNIFIGYQTGQTNTLGAWNTFMGYQAGFKNTGSDNTFIGYKAGNQHQSKGGNVYIGSKAGENATNGEQNVVIGEWAGSNMTTASKNNFIGFQAGYNTSYGSRNVFMGNNSGYSNSQGSNNIFLGDSAGFGNTVGYKNVYIGTLAGQVDKFGNQNVYIGDEAGKNATGQYNTFVGYQAGINDDQFSNSYFGKNAGSGNVNGYRNTYLGSNAGEYTFEGNENTFIGASSGYSHKTGNNNIFIGTSAASMDTNSNSNIVIGCSAATFPNSTGANKNLGDANVIIGNRAGYNSTFGDNIGGNNVFIGSQSGYETAGSSNVFIGNNSGYGRIGSNLLCIENSYTYRNTALIEGSFTARSVSINGTFTFNAGTNSITLPTSRGTTGYVLSTDGLGGTSWINPAKSKIVSSFDKRDVLTEILMHAPTAKKDNPEILDATLLPNNLQSEDNLVNINEMAAYNYKVNYEQQVVINELMNKLKELSNELTKLSNENKELKLLLEK